jgi:glycosyltransferase involved in cell wall biosynthesis
MGSLLFQPTLPPIIDSFSVIVPMFNLVQNRDCQVILQTLNSIDASIDFFQANYPFSQQVEFDLVIVDDGSVDATLETINPWVKDRSYCQLISYPRNLGVAAARNTGVSMARGQALFFCDGDDLFFREHIYWAFNVLNQPISAEPDQPEYFGAVKTKVHTADSLHPHWQQAIANTLVLNLCLRRELHDFIQGFPEDEVFRTFPYGGEDLAYNTWLRQFCHVAQLDQTTVEYIRYPGSQFDRQFAKFQTAPGEYQDHLSATAQGQQQQIAELIQNRLVDLQAKLSDRQP